MTNFLEWAGATQQTQPSIPPPFRQPAAWDERQQGVVLADRSSSGGLVQVLIQDPYKQTQIQRDLTAQLRILQRHYTIVDSDRYVSELLEDDPTLFGLLVEAVEPLQLSFGKKRILHIRVQRFDDDTLLKVAVQLPPDFPGPEEALKSFDSEWWMNNCQRSTGTLLFDYEIQDAV